MDTITRRRFLTAGGVVAAGALAAGGTAYGLRDILATAGQRAPGRILVLVTLYGGNDGLNTVIPYADPAYHAARPGLSYDEGAVLKLADGVGLNPGLAGLHALYGQGRLAIVRGVGYPKPDRSHFRSMDIWQTASPEQPAGTGWLGRWLDTAGGDPRLAVSFEPVLPPLLAGATSAGATVPGGALRLPPGVTTPVLTGLGVPAAADSPARARAAACFADLVRVQDLMTGVAAGGEEADEADEPATATGGQAPPLDQQLALVARCVEAGAATRVYSVSLGGFDLHADEKAAQEAQLGKLDKPLAAFVTRLAGSAAGREVVVAVYSEFGRRVRANASAGTDHGTASALLLLGAGVPGGLYGEPPSLTDLADGDLRHTVDFRDVYAMLLADVLGAEPEPILGGWTGRLTFS
ncbi:DUF1501 domain-containing protein [Actinoplanes sp. NPDC049599]|uniref:DUF1501 domain-containing protein n=1 Tax=Actinoplanes sp. NPDC049599 TaxID=3363903 RepID=UPI0037A7E394